ncbi:hypothetical protein DFQ28_003072 [Apophysomyces sp. BC1034]|nr:hypothetical protein DFQ30_001979 [Apophysomyces sp. BC1015]KAG0179282.1 hypothetical protein DFQ29_002284 [Apophysomyces sp. BC1021]KAG0189710.1 hypothetical protein DFQ28_003072 [Apophysomyces sp. BC1034]
MFEAPPKTLKKSLHNLLDHAQEYLAEVCFRYPSDSVWAHRAVLLTRTSAEFRQRFVPELMTNNGEGAIVVDISNSIPLPLLRSLLRFWYTSEFCPGEDLMDSNDPVESGPSGRIRCEIETLQNQLGVQLISLRNENLSDFDQLGEDLSRMRNQQLGSDVRIQIFPAPKKQQGTRIPSKSPEIPSILCTPSYETPVSFPVHRFILAARSTYFYAMFCTDFREAGSSTLHLTDDLFSSVTLDVILRYIYTDTISVSSSLIEKEHLSPLQHRISLKKYSLRVLKKAFYAADYLGHFKSIGLAILNEMTKICHEFKCTCSDCAMLLPSMLLFAEKNVEAIPAMRPALITMYTDPVQSIPPLWPQKSFAILTSSMLPLANSTDSSPLSTISSDTRNETTAPSNMINEISTKLLSNVTKHNAIHVLHSLHLCLSKLRGADPAVTWSRSTYDLLAPVLHYTVGLVSQNFEFYCVEYPILLSCVDNIGHGFSVDFLDFLLKRVLNEGIQDANAGMLYQGVVKHLIGRQEVVQSAAVDGVLIEARQTCIAYIARRWVNIKALGGLSKLQKETLRMLSDDIRIPYRALTKHVDSDFSSIFSFRPKAAKAAFKSKMSDIETGYSLHKMASYHGTRNVPRRFSLGNLRRPRSSSVLDASAMATRDVRGTRPRSSSTGATARPYVDQISMGSLTSQPSIHLLSLEAAAEGDQSDQHVPLSSRDSFISLTDALLPIDILTHERQPLSRVPSNDSTGNPRPTRLTFELPTAPIRAKSPAVSYLSPKQSASSQTHNRSPRRSRWTIGSNSDVSDDEEATTMITPVIGAKVELLRRPLPTLGTIKYVGQVNFAKGVWVGVELESRLGKSDGSIDGTRYFQTDAQRGVFVKPDDFKILSMLMNKT